MTTTSFTSALSDLFDLHGSVAVVTGGGSGLGMALAQGLAAQGAFVHVWDLDGDSASRCASIIRSDGHMATSRVCDVTSREQVDAAVGEVLSGGDAIDVLVTSAGIAARASAETMTEAEWARVIDVNLTGTWRCSQAVGRSMIEGNVPGRIVNVASIAALVGLTSGNVNYAASKGGVVSMMRTMAIEWAPLGIRVNAIAPTHFRTPLVERAIEMHPEMETYFLDNIPIGRLGEAIDIVGPGVFLASKASAMVTGHVLVVDGGHTVR